MIIKNAGSMTKRLILPVFILLIAAGAIVYFTHEEEPLLQYRTVARHVLSTHKANQPLQNMITACSSADCRTVEAVSESETGKKEEAKNKDEIHAMFQADERDNLVLNENTRLNIEKLYALNTPEELAEKMQKLSAVLPGPAYRQVVNLTDYFEKYTRNMKEIYPPDVQPATLEEVLERFRGMHDLRLSYFGADVASAFYAKEEKQSLQLLYLMAIEKDEGISLDEKARRAQQLLQTNPELAAAYDPDQRNESH
jgi:hypothetical protein